MKKPKIKICGLTKPKEAEYLNAVSADYAGFVFFEKSKRNVTLEQAKEIQNRLLPEIKAVAVTVSPDQKLLKEIEKAGFDAIQIHGELKPQVLAEAQIPIFRACNLQCARELEGLEHHANIAAYVVDAEHAGSGRTFTWQESAKWIQEKKNTCFFGKPFILAGGLNADNVREGIRLFSPEVVDVSTGVEGLEGKAEALIKEFVRKVQNYE